MKISTCILSKCRCSLKNKQSFKGFCTSNWHGTWSSISRKHFWHAYILLKNAAYFIMVITLISSCCQQNEKWVIYWVKWFFYLVWLFADSTEPPTFESVIDPLEKARVPLYYSLYTGRQLGSGKAGRYFDAYKKVYSTRPRDCNSHLSVWTIISLVLDWLKGSLMIMNEFNKIW